MNLPRSLVVRACLGLLWLAAFSGDTFAASFLIEGEGNRSTSMSSPIGVPGEQVSISVALNSEDFYYRSVANPIWRYLEPLRTIPVSVVGSESGAYPSVSPIGRLVALELTDDANVDDQIGLDVSSDGGGSASLFTLYCKNDSCFNGDEGPFTTDAMFDLLEEAFTDTANWQMGTSLPGVYAGPEESFLWFTDVEWTLTNLDAPTSLSIEPTYDAAYLMGETPQLVDGGTSLRIGGFPASSTTPIQEPVFEFPLTGIPRSADILSATLQLDPYVSSGAPRVEVVGFAGDGVASLRDGTIDGPVLAVTEPMSVSTYEDIELDPVYVESLLGGASHLGLRLASLDDYDYLGFDAMENTFSLSQPPTLVIEYVSDAQPGDYNEDGVVDAADYTVWRDGDSLDSSPAGYDLWRSNYGVSAAAPWPPTQQPAPEPTAAMLLTLVSLGVVSRRNRRVPCVSA